MYEGIVEIEIKPNDSSPFIHTYYSLDGSDPEDGYLYESPFIITSSTTVYAKNKFLWRWSEPYRSTYRFESMQNITVNHADYDLSDRLISLDGLFTGIIIVAFSIICLKAVFDALKNLFKI